MRKDLIKFSGPDDDWDDTPADEQGNLPGGDA